MYVNRLKHTYSYYNNIYIIRSQELFLIFFDFLYIYYYKTKRLLSYAERW